MKALSGYSSRQNCSISSLRPARPSSVSARMSPPAEKARSPLAVTTTRVTASSAAQASSWARRRSTMPWVTALSAAGRLSVTTPAAPRRSNRISSVITRLQVLSPTALVSGEEGSGVEGRKPSTTKSTCSLLRTPHPASHRSRDAKRPSPPLRGGREESKQRSGSSNSRLRRPDAGFLQARHGLIGEFGLRRIAADDEHKDRLLVRVAFGDVLEAADHAGRERDDVERLQVDIVDLAFLVLPARAPGAGHGDEGFVGVVIVHLRPVAGLGLAVAEVEAFADLDRRHARRLVADRRGRILADVGRRLEADDVVKRALAARHLAVRQAAVGAFEILEARDALHHFLACQITPRQTFHRLLPPTLLRCLSKSGTQHIHSIIQIDQRKGYRLGRSRSQNLQAQNLSSQRGEF